MNTTPTDSFPKLLHAPITEAVIDIRAELDSTVTLEDLDRFRDDIKGRFTQRRVRRSVTTQIDYRHDDKPPVVIAPSVEPDGYIFEAPAEKLVAQSRLDGFTLSKLTPYDTWEAFSREARMLWAVFQKIARPTKITRVAVRYINRIEMPLHTDLREYVLTGPEIARGIPQSLSSFFMRLEIPGPSEETAIITQTTQTSERQDAPTFSLIFDIDVFRVLDLDPGSERLWTNLEELRRFENTIFFNSLTFEALRRYGLYDRGATN